MIKINLSPQKKKFRLPVVLGIDLGLLNIKLILVALLLIMAPPFFFQNKWEEEAKLMDNEILSLKETSRKLSQKIKQVGVLQEKVDAFNNQERKLNKRLAVVKKLIKMRKNPVNILLYLTKNTPDDLWLKKVEIDNDQFRLEGNSLTYTSIGKFLEGLKSSIFFGDSLNLEKSETVKDEYSGKRKEYFSVSGKVERYR